MTIVWTALALVMGFCITLQGTINSSLAARIGTGTALLANTVIVLLGSFAIFLFVGDGARFSLKAIFRVPWHQYLGGLCGFTIIFLSILLFPRLGAGVTLTLAIAAQLTLAVVIDHFGFMGVPENPITLTRVLGVVLVGSGAALLKFF